MGGVSWLFSYDLNGNLIGKTNGTDTFIYSWIDDMGVFGLTDAHQARGQVYVGQVQFHQFTWAHPRSVSYFHDGPIMQTVIVDRLQAESVDGAFMTGMRDWVEKLSVDGGWAQ